MAGRVWLRASPIARRFCASAPLFSSFSPIDDSEVARITASLRALVFDCDGVLWNGDNPVAGAAESIAALRASGKRVMFLTNNSTKTRAELMGKLERLGFQGVGLADVMNSSHSAARFLAGPTDQGALALTISSRPRVLVVGTPPLATELEALGIDVVRAPADTDINTSSFARLDPDPSIGAVVVGADPGLTYSKLAHAALHLQDPTVRFVCTNMDAADNVGSAERPRLMPGAGTVVGALRACSGREPLNCGKGGDWIPRLLLAELEDELCDSECSAANNNSSRPVAMVGDRMETDVAFGRQCGFVTLLPLTGVTTRGMLRDRAAAESENKIAAGDTVLPHFVISSVASLK